MSARRPLEGCMSLGFSWLPRKVGQLPPRLETESVRGVFGAVWSGKMNYCKKPGDGLIHKARPTANSGGYPVSIYREQVGQHDQGGRKGIRQQEKKEGGRHRRRERARP